MNTSDHMPDNEVLLRVAGLGKRFGGVRAVQNLDFEVRRGEVVGLIGPNGAGKTTVFSMIGGAEKPTTGTIEFEGRPIAGLRPSRIAQLGVARTFQIVRPLGRLTERNGRPPDRVELARLYRPHSSQRYGCAQSDDR
jgi:branched-chain amino acid transport system ATP-binding protein